MADALIESLMRTVVVRIADTMFGCPKADQKARRRWETLQLEERVDLLIKIITSPSTSPDGFRYRGILPMKAIQAAQSAGERKRAVFKMIEDNVTPNIRMSNALENIISSKFNEHYVRYLGI
ncbi:MAG TPA: hypothetical protein VE862_11160 [Candidatus Acidoferrum sp.]|nr:hypothetical protein [Candidatus Acidoferrum sp.]